MSRSNNATNNGSAAIDDKVNNPNLSEQPLVNEEEIKRAIASATREMMATDENTGNTVFKADTIDYKIAKVKDYQTVLLFVGDVDSGVGKVHYTHDGAFRLLGEMTIKGIQIPAQHLSHITASLSKVAMASWHIATINANLAKKEETTSQNVKLANKLMSALPESNPFA